MSIISNVSSFINSSGKISERDFMTLGGANITLSGLVKRYGQNIAIDNVSLPVEAGEFLALLGPSGCGKTSILKCIAGFENPDSGEITIDGHRIDRLSPDRRNIGMVFQSYALFPHMSVAQNIAFPLRMRGRSHLEQKSMVAEAIGLVGLQGLEDRAPSQLSGGQQQRVALARSIVFQPPVLLLDEPLSALDKKLREQMQIELKKLQRRLGVTLIFVTHDQYEALTMADRIAVMRQGRLEQLGTPRDVFEQPATEFVADFIGESNVMAARITDCSPDGTAKALINGLIMPCTARKPEELIQNDAVNIRVRPEHLRFNAEAATGLRGTITNIVYEGQTIRTHIIVADGLELQQRSSTEQARDLMLGESVCVSWQANAALAFKV